MSSPLPRSVAAPQRLADVPVIFDASGAMMLPGEGLLVVSDLHLEKGSSYAARGQFLPPYDTRATLSALSAVIDRYRPTRILTLGDTFHDRAAEGRMADEDAETLASLCRSCDWIFVLGNHDPAPPERFAGAAYAAVAIGGLTFVHEPGDVEGWNVAGHLHPCASVGNARGRLRRRCFVTDGTRLVMPAFGAYTGGLNVRDRAFAGVFSAPPEVHVCGERRTYRVSRDALHADGRGPAFVARLGRRA